MIGSRGEASATELARELPVSRQAVNKHLANLTAAGLVADRRAGRAVLYRLTPAPMTEAMTWMTRVGGRVGRRGSARCEPTCPSGGDPRGDARAFRHSRAPRAHLSRQPGRDGADRVHFDNGMWRNVPDLDWDRAIGRSRCATRVVTHAQLVALGMGPETIRARVAGEPVPPAPPRGLRGRALPPPCTATGRRQCSPAGPGAGAVVRVAGGASTRSGRCPQCLSSMSPRWAGWGAGATVCGFIRGNDRPQRPDRGRRHSLNHGRPDDLR